MSCAVSSLGTMLYPDRYAFRLLPGRHLKIIISLPPFLLRCPLLDQMIAMKAVAAAHRPPSSARISLARLLRIVTKRVTKLSAGQKRSIVINPRPRSNRQRTMDLAQGDAPYWNPTMVFSMLMSPAEEVSSMLILFHMLYLYTGTNVAFESLRKSLTYSIDNWAIDRLGKPGR